MTRRRNQKLNEEQIVDLEAWRPVMETMVSKWHLPISKVRKANRNFETWLVFADTHIPHQNKPTINVLLKLCEDINPDGLAILGDFMDLSCISHWNKSKPARVEGKRLIEDYAEGNAILDEFDRRLAKNTKKIFLYGNHERFYNDMTEEFPVLTGLGEPSVCLKLAERGFKIYAKQNEIVKLGKLSMCHGMYTGDTAVKKHVQAFMTNVLFGHVHSQAEFCAPSPAKDISIYGASLGCTCDMNPDYLQNSPHKWTHGFAVVYVYDREYFDVDLKRVINGKVIFNDKLYDGNR